MMDIAEMVAKDVATLHRRADAAKEAGNHLTAEGLYELAAGIQQAGRTLDAMPGYAEMPAPPDGLETVRDIMWYCLWREFPQVRLEVRVGRHLGDGVPAGVRAAADSYAEGVMVWAEREGMYVHVQIDGARPPFKLQTQADIKRVIRGAGP